MSAVVKRETQEVERLRILFLIRSLDVGGAERQLVVLANELSRRGDDVAVAVFYGGGALEADLHVPLYDLGKRCRWDFVGFFGRLLLCVRKFRPSAIYGFLGTANVLATILALASRNTKSIIGLRASDIDFGKYESLIRVHSLVERLVSPFATLIVCNSFAGARHATAAGYRNRRIEVIPNGIELGKFTPNKLAGVELRRELGLSPEVPLIVVPARIDPIKDHHTFLEAAGIVDQVAPNVRYVCVGGGAQSYLEELKDKARAMGLGAKVIWAGERQNMVAFYSAASVVCLSSVSEGFPNVLGEAMACGARCVSTDVGDAAVIVGVHGRIVPKQDARALAKAIIAEVQEESASDPRAWVKSRFGVEAMVDRTEEVLRSLGE